MIVRTHKVSFSPDRKPMPKVLKIGFEGDNMVERIVFKLPDVADRQTAQLMIGGAYANMVMLSESDEDDRYYVDLTAELIGEAGNTEAYAVINGSGGEVWQSDVLRLTVGDVPDVDDEIEQRFPTAIEQMRQEMAAWSPLQAEIGAQYAGMLLYVGADGRIAPLMLGAGLRIVDGALVVTGSGAVVAELTVDADGNAFISGADLGVDVSGEATVSAMTLTVDDAGNAVLK